MHTIFEEKFNTCCNEMHEINKIKDKKKFKSFMKFSKYDIESNSDQKYDITISNFLLLSSLFVH